MEMSGYNDKSEALELAKTWFKDNWKTSSDYQISDPKTFKGAPLPEELRKNVHFKSGIYYISFLYEIVSAYRKHDPLIPDSIIKELFWWEKRGGQCIYLSALLYALFLEGRVAKEQDMQFCQGVHMHKCREDNPIGLMMGKEHAGLHAWITVKDAVIDISIRQEELFFDFKGTPIVAGEAPEGLNYYGFVETKDVAKGYCRDSAKEAGTYYLDWIKEHRLVASKVYSDFLEKRINEFKSLL